MKIIFIWISL